MNWDKLRIVIKKEWADTFRNKLVFFTLIFLPLFLTLLPLANLYIMQAIPPDEVSSGTSEDLGPFLPYVEQLGVSPTDPEGARQIVMVGLASIYMVIFFMIPLMIPMMIATDSIVSEKVTKSLEPLLATPISVTELLVAKALAAAGPAVAVTWICYALYGGIAALFVPPAVLGVILGLDWIVGVLLLSPLMALLAVGIGIIVSSRVNDTRSAQQISGLVVLPLMLVFIPMFLGLFTLTAGVFVIGAAILVVLDVVVLRIATALFRRETILTRWR
jgi:ABC-2 type transport system permease protein